MNTEIRDLEQVAVDSTKLASNFPDIARDCYGLEGATLASEIQNRFPLVYFLLGTSLSRQMRNRALRDRLALYQETVGEAGQEETKWMLETPRNIWSLPPQSTQGECCWLPFDFAKCAGKVPVNLLCLKDCGNILDDLIGKVARYGQRDAVPPIANTGDTIDEVRKRIDRMSMAFFTAYNVILGMDNVYTDTLKPFHGLLAVLENQAVMKYNGADILAAFAWLGCRFDMLGGRQVIAVNPVIYSSIAAAIVPDVNGNLPAGWTKNGNEITFKGRRFIQDKLVPVDVATGTGEAWVLDEETLGMWLGTDLAPTDDFIRYSGINTVETPNCGEECMYMYNFGTVFGTDANKLAVITNIPVQSACTGVIADLANLVNPNTLIPRA